MGMFDPDYKTATELAGAAERYVDELGPLNRSVMMHFLNNLGPQVRGYGLIAIRDELNRRDGLLNGWYVQVKFNGTSTLYTFKDPSGALEVGDLVQPYRDKAEVATVAALGRGKYPDAVKTVHAKLEKTDL